jgi:hypothetical protein
MDDHRRRWSEVRLLSRDQLDEGIGHPGVLGALRRLLEHDPLGSPLQADSTTDPSSAGSIPSRWSTGSS